MLWPNGLFATLSSVTSQLTVSKKEPKEADQKTQNTHKNQTHCSSSKKKKTQMQQNTPKNPNHSKKGVLLNILNIPSATFLCCKMLIVYAWPLWGLGKNVWAGDWMVAVKINLFNLSVNHICLLRTPRTSEMLFVILTVLRRNCDFFFFMIEPWIQRQSFPFSKPSSSKWTWNCGQKSWIYNMVYFYVFASSAENTFLVLAASHSFNELHFGNMSLCLGRKKILKGRSEFLSLRA